MTRPINPQTTTSRLKNGSTIRRASHTRRASQAEALSGIALAAELRKRPPDQAKAKPVDHADDNIAAISPYLLPGRGHSNFTLPFTDPLAARRLYDRRWAVLPSAVADLPCSHMEARSLLDHVNTIFGTSFALTRGVDACLVEFIDDGCDLGQVYGHLRPWLPRIHTEAEFSHFPSTTRARKEVDYTLRSSAMDGHRITNPRIPPRRVWDLFANRVIPYYAIDPSAGYTNLPGEVGETGRLPKNLWTVSHSWASPPNRDSVLTNINGKAWRVPIPHDVTLDDIRDELLILGAEYVFLDVLCLRQHDKGHPEFENMRKREWRLDIPTIGHVYDRTDTPVIVYFNGLGLPFRDEHEVNNDPFHWFNRVWTVQETPRRMIVGGLEQKLDQFDTWDRSTWPVGLSPWLLHSLAVRERSSGLDWAVLRHIATLEYSNPVDQIAVLGYVAGCASLPVYDADLDVEVAWGFLVDCLPAPVRLSLLFSNFPRAHTWRPTWAQVLAAVDDDPKIGDRLRSPVMYDEEEQLEHIDSSSPRLGYNDGLDANCHKAFVIEGCRINVPIDKSESLPITYCTVDIPLEYSGGYKSMMVTSWGDSISPDSEYALISIGCCLYWIVAEVVGVRRIDGERALEVTKVSTVSIPETDRLASGTVRPGRVNYSRRFVVYR